jgi:hypothetical protein
MRRRPGSSLTLPKRLEVGLRPRLESCESLHGASINADAIEPLGRQMSSTPTLLMTDGCKYIGSCALIV